MKRKKPESGNVGANKRAWATNWFGHYVLAVAIYAATIGLSLLLRYFETRVNLTIPVVLALVVVAWYGGRGPGLLLSVLFQATTIIFAPLPPNSTVPQAVFTHFSVFALYVFLILMISRINRIQHDLRQERDRLRAAEKASDRRTREITTLFEFTDSIQHARSMEQVYDAAIKAMFRTLECDRASVLLFDDANVMRFVASKGLSESYKQAVEGHSPWNRDSEDPQPFGISDLVDAELTDELRETIRNEGIASLGFIPLVSNDRLIGKLMIYFDSRHDFSESEFKMAMTVGRQIAAGVERKRTETLLMENEERLRLATQTGKVGVWDWHIRENRIDWTDSVYEIHGVNKGSFGGTVEDFSQLVHPDDRDRVRKRIQQALSGEVPYDLQLRLLRPDGSERILFTNAIVLRDGEGPFRMIGATVDITDRLNIEQARRESEIMHRIVEAQESERRRIARDLHDHLGQRMTGLRLQIETLAINLNGSATRVIEDIKNTSMQIDRDIGFLSWELRPTELEQLGLADALRTFVREWSKQYNIAADFKFTENRSNRSGRLPEVVETNLYRIVQEALNNVLKHSGAKEVNVLLQQREDDLVLIVEDNGRGFERNSGKLNGNGTRGLGLIGMHERAAAMKGSLEIDSSHGRGTTIIATIPIH